MNTCIALFRGINVGGKNILSMKELVVILEDIGARNIKTYQTFEKQLNGVPIFSADAFLSLAWEVNPVCLLLFMLFDSIFCSFLPFSMPFRHSGLIAPTFEPRDFSA